MKFVRKHRTLLFVAAASLFVAIALTSLIFSQWAQDISSHGLNGIGWVITPLVRFAAESGVAGTFIVAWVAAFMFTATAMIMFLDLRRLTPVRK
jgi:hypothetical protein